MNNDVLETFIANKYGTSLQQTKTDIHHYEKQIEEVATVNGVILEQNTNRI